ncbi:MAG TPA: response regulator transcription factor, partial [Opitutus sp.]|nr:response regulator transcription factor [Opitutus sp.]
MDDHPFMRAGLAQLIEKQPGMTVCGEAGDPAAAMSELAKGGVDLVLSDITMPGRGGIEFIKDVLALHPELPILVVSMHDEVIYAERVLRAGARGYIMKRETTKKIVDAIREVLEGKLYVSDQIAALFAEKFVDRR